MNSFVITLLIVCLTQIEPGQSSIGKKFLASKGTWGLPVSNGVLDLNNNTEIYYLDFVTILTDSSRPVTAVFEGTVRMVNAYDSLCLIVVKSGDYFVGYSNLTNVSLKKGDQISRGDKLGNAGRNLDGAFAVDLRISDPSGELKVRPWFRKDAKQR